MKPGWLAACLSVAMVPAACVRAQPSAAPSDATATPGATVPATTAVTANAGAPAPAAPPVNTPKVDVPRVFYTHPGQFEIIVSKADDAQQALALGRVVWAALAGPVGLPAEGFSSPVSIRLVPAESWTDSVAFTTTIETPGRVSVRVRWADDVDPLVVRRAFVQGLLLRQAAAWHGVAQELNVPLWLEQACTAWSLVRERPAMLDSFQQESATIGSPPSLRALLAWERGSVDSRAWELSSLWLLLQLQAESSEAWRWGGWLRGIMGGASATDTLPRFYTGLWADAAAQEIWWQTSFHHQRRLQGIPVMTAEASRSWLADRSRWLAGRDGREVLLGLDELITLRKEKWIQVELAERTRQTQALLGVIHPFYANPAISMGRVYEAALKGNEKQFKEALVAFERDALDARDLEDTVNATLNTAPRR